MQIHRAMPGETREQRLLEFLVVNRDSTVAGLREGCLVMD